MHNPAHRTNGSLLHLDSLVAAVIAFVAPVIVLEQPSTAQGVKLWQPNAVGQWDIAGNWVNGWVNGIPGALDRAGIATGTAEINQNVPATCTSLGVGRAGNGECVMTQGDLKVGGPVNLGTSLGSQGTLTLKGGALTSASITIGGLGKGIVNQTGGSLGTQQSPLAQVLIGSNAANTGYYGMTSGKLFAELVHVGPINPTAASWLELLPGGAAAPAATIELLILGELQGARGTVTVAAGELETTEQCTVGKSGRGTLQLQGGEFRTDAALDNEVPLIIGQLPGSDGLLVASGGQLKAFANGGTTIAVDIARAGRGTLRITGGTHAIDGNVTIGSQPGSEGLLDLLDGSLTIAGWLELGSAAGPNGLPPAGKAILSARGGGPGNLLRLTVENGIFDTQGGECGVFLFKHAVVKTPRIKLANRILGNGKFEKLNPNIASGVDYFLEAGPGSVLSPEDVDSEFGALHFGGDAVLVDAIIEIDIHGSAVGVNLDQVTFEGPVVAEGAIIEVSFGPDLSLASLPVGTAFAVIGASTFSGSFDCLLPETGNPGTALTLAELALPGPDGPMTWLAVTVVATD